MNQTLRKLDLPGTARQRGTMPPSTRPTASTPNPADVDRLDALLGSLIDEHRTLLALAGEQHEAIVAADMKRLGNVIEQTGDVLQRVQKVESQRQRLVARPDGRPSTLDELMTVVDAASQERLTERSGALRGLIQQVQTEQEAVKEASAALANHMHGLMQQVARKLSHSGTYGRAGRVENKSPVMTGVDVGA